MCLGGKTSENKDGFYGEFHDILGFHQYYQQPGAYLSMDLEEISCAVTIGQI